MLAMEYDASKVEIGHVCALLKLSLGLSVGLWEP